MNVRRVFSLHALLLGSLLSALAWASDDRLFADGFEDPPPPPPMVMLSVPMQNVGAGQPLQLIWTSIGAQSCVADAMPSVPGWSGTLAPQGTRVVVLANVGSSYLFLLTCTNAGGSVTVQAGPVTVV